MFMKFFSVSNFLPYSQVVFTLIWLSLLGETDAYFSVYVIVAFISFFLQFRRLSSGPDHFRWGVVGLSTVFSFAVILANYPLFTTLGDPSLIAPSTSILMNVINGFLCLIGGICTFYPILHTFFLMFPICSCTNFVSEKNAKYLPVILFSVLMCLNLVHLIFVEYPGNMTEDTFSQISEMTSGSYSNFNTFWHTMILRFALIFGYGIFSDSNHAVAFFCILQMAILCAAFVHCTMTMVKFGIPKQFIVVSFLLYLLLPYHLAFSITIWKDVLFGAGCLLFLSSMLRIKNALGNILWNYVVFVLGSLLFILSRTNGWIIYLVSFLIFFGVFRKDRLFLAVMGGLALTGWFLLNPVLSMLHVSGGDVVESFSIPIQQISRVIADGRKLTDEETELLSYIVDLEEVPQLYVNWLSDPMKVEVRSKDYTYFQHHLKDYGALWIRLGFRYPWEYVKAWVDQTKGYWNAGYDYALYSETIIENPYGIEKIEGENLIATLFRLYFGLSRHLIFFEPFHSIGLHIWLLILCFLVNVAKKRTEWVLSVPLLILVVGLWAGTPVFCSFRYVYPLFVCFPLILSTTLWNSKKDGIPR